MGSEARCDFGMLPDCGRSCEHSGSNFCISTKISSGDRGMVGAILLFGCGGPRRVASIRFPTLQLNT